MIHIGHFSPMLSAEDSIYFGTIATSPNKCAGQGASMLYAMYGLMKIFGGSRAGDLSGLRIRYTGA